MQDSADDDHGMRPHDVDYGVATELPQMICADDCIIAAAPDIVHAGFEFNQIIDVRLTVCPPVHAANDTAQGEPALGVGQLFECLQHQVLIEAAFPKVCIGARSKLKLASLVRRGRIDSGRRKTLKVVILLFGIHHMNGPVATVEAVLDKRQENAILLFITVEQGTDMSH